jgi:hypothetical protein
MCGSCGKKLLPAADGGCDPASKGPQQKTEPEALNFAPPAPGLLTG